MIRLDIIFSSLVGCIIGWFYLPKLPAWIKEKRKAKRSPEAQETDCNNNNK